VARDMQMRFQLSSREARDALAQLANDLDASAFASQVGLDQ
jgi:hypothetical protein